MAKKWVYLFTEGDATMRNLLGGKGANLAEMTNIGLPVPQGFTITTEACTQYYEDGREINDEIQAQINEYIVKMEEITGKKFGDSKNPLLVSVRSGARASMPGMMDTILNLGLNETVVKTIAEQSGNPRWAWDCYRRFIQMYSDVVMEVGKKYFEELIDQMKEKRGVKQDVELTADDLKELADQFKAEYKAKIGKDFPDDPKEQLMGAIKAVFRSWDNPRANVYRRDNDIPYSWGTAVNVQSMAFGNMGDDCGTGVAFTRDPATGAKGLFGEFLTNAQGEDVVAGVRTPMKIAEMADKFPEAFAQFKDVCGILENHYRDMQDMEFTVEHGKLYMLQTRNGKRTAQAALKIACDLVDEGMRTEEEAVAMIDPRNLDTLLHPQFDAAALKAATPLGKGLGASPGAACGKVVFSAEDAEVWHARGEKVVLVRLETSPEDITGMKVSQGILTVRGGMTSHAAVVARGMGTCCVSGCGDIAMDEANKTFTLAGTTFNEGSEISIDGTTGNIYAGIIPTVDATIAGEFGRVMAWADKYRTLKVRTNADTPADAKKARELGAEGIGLCRTEHMFFEEDRIAAFREMICADNAEEREVALNKILPYQQGDFEGLFEALEGNPVTIRFLDPPLHEFVPTEEEDIKKLADAQGKSVDDIKTLIASLHEFNPMMGHRGSRLDVTYPEIAVMQTKAVIRAAINVQKRHPDWTVKPEIMIPLICEKKELVMIKKYVVDTANAEIAASDTKIEYEVGTMIEIPRAALLADEIAEDADFFCFGTNDLTQMTFGFSRDDAGKFLQAYYEAKIFENDPFAKLDRNGVGKLMKMAIDLGKPVNPKLHVGICGEHGGDPASVEFCHQIGLDYVSCSPFRVPIARLAAAQAAIASKAEKETTKDTKKTFVDDETKEKLKEAAEKAQSIAIELAETSTEIAKAGLAGLKAGLEEAKKAYNESKKN
ncbi:MAG: pyruvate, phosphate dikinase [Lachnospiraceae bacterium]|nr:pyruvate, phosphate dikinase [Lachnospiraceae bacterium]